MSWYDSDLKSGTIGHLIHGNNGTGQSYGLEIGKRTAIGGKLSITPQVQTIYSMVDFRPLHRSVRGDGFDGLGR